MTAPQHKPSILPQVALAFGGFIAGFYANYVILSARFDNLEKNVTKLTEIAEAGRDKQTNNETRLTKIETYLFQPNTNNHTR